ncbi:type II toxin-antitoxin system VapC family toxin [Negadavirga shengliensis]|uniref:Ribonuclease VapC n=1 Tax=Negadavirga shengliensis TaxID=1389218 RepID=A0ABV9T4D1_9BACT
MVADTSIFIEHLRARKKTSTLLYKYFDQTQLFLSAVTMYELLMGATTDEKKNDVKIITEDLIVLPFSAEVASEAAKIYHDLKKRNKLIEFRDIFIAATSLANDLPLLTLNEKHFKRIKGLDILPV